MAVRSTLLAGALLAIIVILVRQGVAHDRTLIRYEATRTLTEVTDLLVRGAALDLPAGARSFGVYALDGRAVLAEGQAPELMPAGVVPPHDGADTRLLEDVVWLDRTTVRVVRVAGSRGLTGRGGGPDNRVIYLLDLDVAALVRASTLRVAILVALGLVAAALGAVTLRALRTAREADEALAERERLAMLGMAARTIAHEIRNPVASILVQVAMIRRALARETPAEPSMAGAADAALRAITEESERLNRMAGEVRTFLTEPRGTPECVAIGAACAAIVARSAVHGRVSVSDQCADVRVLIDPGRLDSIVMNLLNNAAASSDHSPHADTSIDVGCARVAGRGRREWIELTVADRGAGLPPTVDHDQLFDPFFTSRETGSGVGLATVRSFVEAAGGTVRLENREGGGAIARVAFPVADSECQ